MEQHLDKVDWVNLSDKPHAIRLLEKHLDKVDLASLIDNPSAVHLLKDNIDKLDYGDCVSLCRKPYIFTLDYAALKTRCEVYKEELIARALRPDRIQKLIKSGASIDDLFY